MINMHLFNIHYAEIALKGKNRGDFENQLMENIRRVLKDEKIEKIKKEEMRILVYLEEGADAESIKEKLKKVFGIFSFSLTYEIERDLDKIKQLVLEKMDDRKGKEIRVDARRSDKSFKFDSMEVNRQVGQVLKDAGFAVDLKNPDVTITIEIMREKALIYFDKVSGLGGLPVGSAGKVLCLLSGGIDSPVAAWLMMKRGCEVDFLHIAATKDNSKIKKLASQLKEYAQRRVKLFNVTYDEFYKKTFEFKSRAELVLFKRFIVRLAEKIAKEHGYLGIVTGDNLAQVASQTLENLYATDSASAEFPIYRPVLTYDKEEIITLAKKTGTYDISLEEYKDCCSLVAAKDPATRAKLDELLELEKRIEIEKVVDNTLKQMEQTEI